MRVNLSKSKEKETRIYLVSVFGIILLFLFEVLTQLIYIVVNCILDITY